MNFELRWQADSIVMNTQHDSFLVFLTQHNFDLATLATGESMLDGIRQQFVYHQATQHHGVGIEFQRFGIQRDIDGFRRELERSGQVGNQPLSISGEANPGKAFRSIEALIKLCDGRYPATALL